MSLKDFGINPQALAVLALVADTTAQFQQLLHVEAAPWYNGRERGVCFYVRSGNWTRRHCIAVFEHRNSDTICSLEWDEDCVVNPPMATAATCELAYHGGDKGDVAFQVPYGNVGTMAGWVCDRLKNFLAQEHDV